MNDADRPPSLADLHEQLRLVFSTVAAVDEWLDTPDPSLDGLSPKEMIAQQGGPQRVRNVVLRMIHGIP